MLTIGEEIASVPCAFCNSDTSGWTEEQIQDHGPRKAKLAWLYRTKEVEFAICPLCFMSFKAHIVNDFVREHHEPVQKKLDKIIAAVQEAMK